MLNIVVPMAGAGSRFAKAGFKDPKPLIPIFGKPMIQLVVNNLAPAIKHRFIFICQRAHVAEYGLKEKLSSYAPGCILIELDGLTEGAACTVLAAKSWIENDDALMIANSDQFVDADINDYLNQMNEHHLDGLIMTMTATDPKWSFAAIDPSGKVTRVVEKEPISSEATVGIYNFKRGKDFVRGAEEMITNNLRSNGEFYVAPVYNQLIERELHIGIWNIGDDAGNGMHGLGTPSDLEIFKRNPQALGWCQ
jgi:dTDP-glucose pyrophosphorylase